MGAASVAAARRSVGPSVAPLVTPAALERLTADRQVGLAAASLILASRALDGPLVWAVAVLVGLGVAVGAGWNRSTAG